MNTNTLIKILNTIRANAGEEYQELIPEATRNNLAAIGDPILQYQSVRNTFTNELINRIAFVRITSLVAKNPLDILKKGNKPLGDDVQEIFISMAEAQTFDPSGKNLLNRKIPDIKTIFHKMNRQDQYKVTIGRQELAKAFTSWNELGQFVQGCINSLYSGDAHAEFVLFKNVITQAINNNGIKKVELTGDPVTGEQYANEFVKAVKTISLGMTFMSSNYNAYMDVQSDDTKPVKTFTPKENQIIIIDAATSVSVDVDVLAKAFNLSKTDFMARQIVIDAFADPSVRAVIMDIGTAQIYDDLFELDSFYNPEGKYTNYYLDHWQTVSLSCFTNAVALTVPGETGEPSGVSETEE